MSGQKLGGSEPTRMEKGEQLGTSYSSKVEKPRVRPRTGSSDYWGYLGETTFPNRENERRFAEGKENRCSPLSVRWGCMLLWTKIYKIGELLSKEMLESLIVTRMSSQPRCRKCQLHKLQSIFPLLYRINMIPQLKKKKSLYSRKCNIIVLPDTFLCNKWHCFVEYRIIGLSCDRLGHQPQTCLRNLSWKG